jgi:hypothetical protein
MFQTSHSYSTIHAAARCLSGGPIYITDFSGQHDVELIAQMTAGSLTEQTVTLRPSMAGKTIRAFDSYHEGHPLKIATYAEAEGGGTSFLGLFNIAEQGKRCLVPVSDFLGKNGKLVAIGTEAHSSSSFVLIKRRSFSVQLT